MVGLPRVLAHLPSFSVEASLVHNVASGQDLVWERISSAPMPTGELVLLTPGGDLLAVARLERGRLRYERVFTYGLDPRPNAT
jgi:hypothetical protein